MLQTIVFFKSNSYATMFNDDNSLLFNMLKIKTRLTIPIYTRILQKAKNT